LLVSGSDAEEAVAKIEESRGRLAMSTHERHGSGEPQLTEQDLVVAALVGRDVERREQGGAPCAHDLVAVAAEFGDAAVDHLRTVLITYETMRASENSCR
jgi:hypothetical protein